MGKRECVTEKEMKWHDSVLEVEENVFHSIVIVTAAHSGAHTPKEGTRVSLGVVPMHSVSL